MRGEHLAVLTDALHEATGVEVEGLVCEERLANDQSSSGVRPHHRSILIPGQKAHADGHVEQARHVVVRGGEDLSGGTQRCTKDA